MVAHLGLVVLKGVFVIYVLGHVAANNTKLDDRNRGFGTVDNGEENETKIYVTIFIRNYNYYFLKTF